MSKKWDYESEPIKIDINKLPKDVQKELKEKGTAELSLSKILTNVLKDDRKRKALHAYCEAKVKRINGEIIQTFKEYIEKDLEDVGPESW